MRNEERLYVVVKEAVNSQFASYGELALKVHQRGPAEFSYNRLDRKHVMQPSSIVPYVSLAHFIGLLRITADEKSYECILDQEPTPAGLEELVTQKSVAVLEASGFTKESYERAIRKMLRQATIVLPTLREVYQALSLKMTEIHFLQLTTLGGVRRHFGFTLVTRRVMVPTGRVAG